MASTQQKPSATFIKDIVSPRTIFGTDGVRGRANVYPLTPESILKLAQAVGTIFCHKRKNTLTHRPLVLIGKDTRLSGYMIEPALTSGFVSMGMDVVLVGPLPTPAVALLTRSLRAELGVMISASHNPAEDNGLKFFGPDGHKLGDALEASIEQCMEKGVEDSLVSPLELGRARRLDDAPGRYIEYVKSTLPKGLRFDGLRIVIDCAHGAAYKIAPAVFWELGAEVYALGTNPNGFNINDSCGAMNPQRLQEAVWAQHADIGIALDGDADRLVIVDETGAVLEGDFLLAALALSWSKKGLLKNNGIVTTILSNLALENFLKKQGVDLVRTSVGDRYVSEMMRTHHYSIGGEPSGHIILGEASTTGDGILAALHILAYLIESKKKPSYLRTFYKPLPQKNFNIKDLNKAVLTQSRVSEKIQKIQDSFHSQGRIIVRPSGTENLIRIMIESSSLEILDNTAQDLLNFFEDIKIKK